MQWGLQLYSAANDLPLAQMYKWGLNTDVCTRFSSCTNHFFECAEEDVSAVGIAAGVFFNCTNVKMVSFYNFGPTCGNGKNVSIAKWHVCIRYLFIGARCIVPVLAAPGTMYRAAIGISHLHCFIRQTAAADCSKVRDVYNEARFYGVMIADVVKCL
jgi:hypothetical protein